MTPHVLPGIMYGGQTLNVMVFLGRNGWKALSLDPTGANLPRSDGPWTPLRFVGASEIHDLAGLRRYGFRLEREEADAAQEGQPTGHRDDPGPCHA